MPAEAGSAAPEPPAAGPAPIQPGGRPDLGGRLDPGCRPKFGGRPDLGCRLDPGCRPSPAAGPTSAAGPVSATGPAGGGLASGSGRAGGDLGGRPSSGQAGSGQPRGGRRGPGGGGAPGLAEALVPRGARRSDLGVAGGGATRADLWPGGCRRTGRSQAGTEYSTGSFTRVLLTGLGGSDEPPPPAPAPAPAGPPTVGGRAVATTRRLAARVGALRGDEKTALLVVAAVVGVVLLLLALLVLVVRLATGRGHDTAPAAASPPAATAAASAGATASTGPTASASTGPTASATPSPTGSPLPPSGGSFTSKRSGLCLAAPQGRSDAGRPARPACLRRRLRHWLSARRRRAARSVRAGQRRREPLRGRARLLDGQRRAGRAVGLHRRPRTRSSSCARCSTRPVRTPATYRSSPRTAASASTSPAARRTRARRCSSGTASRRPSRSTRGRRQPELAVRRRLTEPERQQRQRSTAGGTAVRVGGRVDLAVGDQHRRPGQQHRPGRQPGHGQPPAGHVDGPRVVQAVPVGPGDRGDDRRAHAGAAGPGLPHAALVHPHRQRSRSAADDELDVLPVRQRRPHLRRPGQVERVERGQVGQLDHDVRVAHAHRGAGPAADGRRGLQRHRRAHLHGDVPGRRHLHGADARPGCRSPACPARPARRRPGSARTPGCRCRTSRRPSRRRSSSP